jgi:hypothetical protein
MAVALWVNGRLVDDVGRAGDLEWSHRWPGGSWTARWAMPTLTRSIHQAVRTNARVELRVGPLRVWGPGRLNDPDYESGLFTADGPARALETVQAIDGSGDPTDDPAVALAAAVARGAIDIDGWDTVPAAFPSTSPRSIKQLLDDCALAESKRWGVDVRNRIIFRSTTAAQTPRWAISPDVVRPALSRDGYASSIQLRYVSALGGVPAVPSAYDTAIAEDPIAADDLGVVEEPADATSLGLLTPTQAQNRANGLLRAGRARLAYTRGYDLTPTQITSLGGAAAYLPFVMADGSSARHYGVIDDRGAAVLGLARDFVIGETIHRAGSPTIRINPADMAARTVGANLEKIGSR